MCSGFARGHKNLSFKNLDLNWSIYQIYCVVQKAHSRHKLDNGEWIDPVLVLFQTIYQEETKLQWWQIFSVRRWKNFPRPWPQDSPLMNITFHTPVFSKICIKHVFLTTFSTVLELLETVYGEKTELPTSDKLSMWFTLQPQSLK